MKQYGQSLDENNQNATGNCENENCNKHLTNNDTGSSQNKSNNKYKTHLLDKYAKTTTEGI